MRGFRNDPDLLALERVLRYLNNWFVLPNGIYRGTVTLSADRPVGAGFPPNASAFVPPLDPSARHFRIIGSAKNDGIVKSEQWLSSETFTGEIWALAIPNAVLALACDVSEWCGKYGAAAASPFVSESFGGYSYSKGAQGGGSSAGGWQQAFAAELRPWRKI